MYNFIKSIFIIFFIFIIQLLLYVIFLKPYITTWGASAEEVTMSMAGDDNNLYITSTRSITINAPAQNVWQWLMQLGADRKGFYSYEFLENALGYYTRYPDLAKAQFENFKVGDVIRGSTDEKKSFMPYNFKVLYIQPKNTFVLENWGTFLLKPIDNQTTQLVIRTQEMKSSYHMERIANYLFVPFHFIMERRMMLGIKSWVEESKPYLSQTEDILWFVSLVLSWVLISLLIFSQRGILKSFFIPLLLSICWELEILLLNPKPMYSSCLLLMICLSIFFIRKVRENKT